MKNVRKKQQKQHENNKRQTYKSTKNKWKRQKTNKNIKKTIYIYKKVQATKNRICPIPTYSPTCQIEKILIKVLGSQNLQAICELGSGMNDYFWQIWTASRKVGARSPPFHRCKVENESVRTLGDILQALSQWIINNFKTSRKYLYHQSCCIGKIFRGLPLWRGGRFDAWFYLFPRHSPGWGKYFR